MKSSFPSPASNSEERLEAWLASQPLTPAPDFVVRTLARIRAEEALVVSAKAGDQTAIDALLDRWLGEQTLEPDYEPALLATQTRRAAEYEEREEARTEKNPRRVVPFPAWARSVVSLAAAACVALVAYFSNPSPVAMTASTASAPVQNNDTADSSDDSTLPAHYAFAYDSKAILQISDSLRDGDALLDSDNVNILTGNDLSTEDDAVN